MGSDLHGDHAGLLRAGGGLRRRLRAALGAAKESNEVNLSYLITGLISFLVLAYLLYVLLRPERF